MIVAATRALHENATRERSRPFSRDGAVIRIHPYGSVRAIHAISCIRTPANLPFPEGWCMKWQQALIVHFVDITPVRTGGSLAVTQGIVVAVYGLDLVEAGPAIYVILALGVARVDKVIAVASVHLVVAFAGDDLIVAAATSEVVTPVATPEAVVPAAALEAVLPVATREAVVCVGPDKRIVAAGAGEDLRQGFVCGVERSYHHCHHREQDV